MYCSSSISSFLTNLYVCDQKQPGLLLLGNPFGDSPCKIPSFFVRWFSCLLCQANRPLHMTMYAACTPMLSQFKWLTSHPVLLVAKGTWIQTYECVRCYALTSSHRWGTADAEIKVPSAENQELSEFLSFNPGVG